LKIGLILFAVFQSLWSIEAGILSFRYAVGLDLFWTFAVCAALSFFDLTVYYYLAEKLKQALDKFPYFKKWLEKTQSRDNSWIIFCYRWQRVGLFVTAFIPHLALFGITAQRIFRFKNGYWWLLFGSVAKVGAVTYGLKIIEYFAQ
jgi:hypothetical protein